MIPSPALVWRLTSLGMTWEDLLGSPAVVLFGSRAAACERADSDWDLLCIGRGQTRLTRGLDLVWVDAAKAVDPDAGWIGCELANHVACHGRVLVGELPWKASFDQQELVIARKRRQLDGHVRGMLLVWSRLNEVYRQRQLTELRRDLQRHARLRAGGVVPPTRTLDSEWSGEAEPDARLLELLNHAGLASGSVVRLLARPVVS